MRWIDGRYHPSALVQRTHPRPRQGDLGAFWRVYLAARDAATIYVCTKIFWGGMVQIVYLVAYRLFP